MCVCVCVSVCVCHTQHEGCVVSHCTARYTSLYKLNINDTHTLTPPHMHITHLHNHTLHHTSPQILVECGTTGGKWLFDCHHWLCLDTGDGRIERELHPRWKGRQEERVGSGRCMCGLVTSRERVLMPMSPYR